jgi:hypothetical protein
MTDLFAALRRISLRHWPYRALWVDLYYDEANFARLYRDGSYDLVARG